jgi:MFS family permease
MTQCAFQLFIGRLYTFYPVKWVFLTCIATFEVGSATCGAAPSSNALIVGRAVAGLGGAGIFSGAIIIFVHTVPLQNRPLYNSLVTAVFGIASVAGPLLGGVLTEKVSWRWCFYINLPLGAFTIVILFFILRIPANNTTERSTWKKIKQRSVAAAVYFSICVSGGQMLLIYYLPVWFQAVKGVSAVESGIMGLPLLLSLVVSSILTGAIITRVGYYKPSMIVACVFMAIGAGLITTFKTDTGHAEWIGYQVIFGLGLGQGVQQASLAIQTVLSRKDVPTGAALVFFAQSLGGSLFISVGQSVFTNSLVRDLSGIANLNATAIVDTGATELRNVVRPESLGKVLLQYNNALTNAYYVSVALPCLAIFGAIAMEWKSVKARRQEKPISNDPLASTIEASRA